MEEAGEHSRKSLVLDGESLTLDSLLGFLNSEYSSIAVAESAWQKVDRARALVEEIVEREAPVYGINTGFGRLANVSIAKADLATLQRNLIRSHACGVGDPLPVETVRLAMLLRINSLVKGHSGVRRDVVLQLLSYLERGITPWVPSQGSVGASGDLAPLSHIAVTLIGEGRVYVDGELCETADALNAAGLSPLELGPKEGLALINGTQVIQAIGLRALLLARKLQSQADLACALSFEALRGNPKAYDPRIAELRNHQEHARVSNRLLAAIKDSALHAHAQSEGMVRVQDPYSLRCVPQVHGASRETIQQVERVFAAEINAVTDNPLLFPESGEVISGGNFHGQPVSMACDLLAIALSEFGAISERRIEQLVNPDLSRLPAFLAKQPGLNSGMMIPQVVAAALASENKTLAHPAVVDSVPTSANQEDHVSMGVWAAQKALRIAENVARILEIELLSARYACQFHRPHRLGTLSEQALSQLESAVPDLDVDRMTYPDMEAVSELVRSSAWLELLHQLESSA